MENNNNNSSNDNNKTNESYNVFRDSLLRYAGYANEVGESFRYQFPKFVIPSYVVSFGYCFADAANTGYTTWTEYDRLPPPHQNNNNKFSRQAQTAYYTFDTLLWQSLASVMIPGATINMIVKASRFVVARSRPGLVSLLGGKTAGFVKEWVPTAFGLGSIPVIIHPIDHAVDVLLDNTTRKIIQHDKSTDK